MKNAAFALVVLGACFSNDGDDDGPGGGPADAADMGGGAVDGAVPDAVALECVDATDCDDGDACTVDTCAPETNTCGHAYDDVTPACAATWTQLAPATAPPAVVWPGMAYDSARDRVVLFGGLPASLSTAGMDDTWEWDGTTWTEITPAARPPGRGVHGHLTYDPRRDRVVLFGGGSQPGAMTYTDLWEYDGTTWTEVALASGPGNRVAGCFADDGDQLVLFGGGLWNPYFDDTWTWSGAAFTQATPPAAPAARQSMLCVRDAWRDRVVMFGGDNGGSLADTWEWREGAWTDAMQAGPPAACCFGITYDSARRRTLVVSSGQTWAFGAPSSP